jgi:alpha-tubulin suppressor-like RCC1 family protein
MKKTLTIFIALALPIAVLGQSPGGVATDLSVWYKADNGVTANASKLVTQWDSSSATNVSLTPNGTAILPYNDQTTYTSTWNFNPTVTFNGTNNYLRNTTTAYLTSVGSVHYIVVAKGTNRNANAQSLFTIAGNDDGFFYTGGSGNTALPTIGNAYNSAAAAITSPDDFGIYSAILPKTAVQGTQRGFYNALKKNYTTPYPITGATYTLPTTGAYIGADGTTGDNFYGDIAEVIIYHSPVGNDIPDADLEKIHSYLAIKYGITLTSTQNYLSSSSQIVWNAASNAGYTNNIAGIGRDATGLNQKQSWSVNSGKQLLIATTGLANTNAANSTALTAGQYLVWGDNGLTKTPTVAISGVAGVNYRFASIWKAQNTGSIGTVRIAWPATLKNLRLIQSSDTTFDGTDTVTNMSANTQTVNGVTYNYADITITDGQYFTLASYVQAPGGVLSTLWYRADKGIVPATGAVTSWTDYSASTITIIPNLATTTSAPAAVDGTTAGLNLNFNPGVTFLAANALGNSSVLNAVSSTNYSIYTSTTPVTGSGYDRVVGLNYSALTTGNKYDSPGIAAANISMRDNAAGAHINTGVTPVTSQYTQLENTTIVRNSFTNNQFQRAMNGAAVTSTMVMSPILTTWPDGGIVLGRNANDGGDDNGAGMTMSETIVFDKMLTVDEINRVDSYLAIKGGITLDINTPNYLSSSSATVWSGSVNTGYNNNIFGIANDKLSDLNQMQSNSINPGQKLIIGAGNSLANTNIANTNTLADGQFLITGDNGLKQSLMTPLSYAAGSNGAINYRFESIWKVQNTGTIGTVTVAWPKSVKNLYLVQSPDAAFDGTDTFTPMTAEVTVNGVVYNTANVTLGNGQFFTFAGFGNAPGGVVSGLSYWYRADKNATNTGATTDVTGWTDVWNETTVAQLGTNTLPKYVLGASNYFNFNPGINFTVGTQTLGNNTVRTLTSLDYDVFTFTKEGTVSGGGNPRIFSVGMDNTTTGLANWDAFGIWPGINITALERRVYGGGTQFPGVAPAFNTTIPSIMYFRNTNTATSKGLNGALLQTPTSFSAVGNQFGGHIFGNTVFSSNGSDNAGFIGHIGETIVYGAGTLTTTERRKVDSYLAIKYGITLGQLSTDHYLDADAAIVWNGAANTTYNNNIFGVAREDIGLFEQKVSTSVNAGTILTVATINDFVNPNDNVARTGFVNDKTYFLLGDNNVTTTTLSSMTINGFTGASRIPRIWLAQRTNTSNTMYFGADLSSYGGGFGSGDHVKMIIADDAAFTTNVVSVNGTYDATTGKWVHNYNFDSGNANRYITYAAVNEVACTTGCNDNTYLNAVNPNTIEYDNIMADETTTIVKQKDGSFYIWGPNTSPNVSTANTNVVLNLLTPTKIDPSTTLPTAGSSGVGFNYTGTPLKAAIAHVKLLLTTDGLYAWGDGGIASSANTYKTPSDLKFGKLTVNNKADGLPPGVSPTNVKMMSGNQETITMVTCSGAAWTFNQSAAGVGSAYLYGDGMVASLANNSIWHRVMTSATQTLDNVVAVRGLRNTKFALTSDGKLYTWGLNTFHNDNTAGLTSNYATEISVPAGVTPKMIGMTEGNNEGQGSYYLLTTNGKLYAMGYNGQKQLGDGTTTTSNVWKEVTATSGSNTLGGNIAWISPAENVNNLPSINVLTNDGKQWGWGRSSQGHLGVVNNLGIAPTYMPGNGTGANELSLSDKVMAIKDGGQHAINFKENSTKYGFIGLNTYGAKGDGTSVAGTQDLKYTYISDLDLCAKAISGVCYKPGILTGTALDTKVGITALSRAGVNADNWPMVRKGSWLTLESKTKAFVPNRVAFDTSGNPVGIAAANFVEGMMVYDTTNKCMKMYSLKEGEASMAWHCISTQTCPD